MLCWKEGPYYYGLSTFTTFRWSSNAQSRIEKPIFHKWYSLWQPQQEASGKGKLSSGGQGATSCTNIQNHQIHAPGKIMLTTSLLFYDRIRCLQGEHQGLPLVISILGRLLLWRPRPVPGRGGMPPLTPVSLSSLQPPGYFVNKIKSFNEYDLLSVKDDK